MEEEDSSVVLCSGYHVRILMERVRREGGGNKGGRKKGGGKKGGELVDRIE